jgi:hypothetical protein
MATDKKIKKTNRPKPDPKNFQYPPSEDIYKQSREMTEIDPEDPSKLKEPIEDDFERLMNEKDFKDDVSGSDLDVPGSELDDEQEKTGNEDEENNHYSIGGDNHNDLEEEKE